jgi:very-short-patch-repair endonuclease
MTLIPAKITSPLEAGLAYVLKCVGIAYECQFRIPGLGRRYIYDFAFPAQKLVVEVQGAIFKPQTAHTSGTGITRDCNKLNLATIAGWRCLQVTSNMIRDGRALYYIERALGIKEQ